MRIVNAVKNWTRRMVMKRILRYLPKASKENLIRMGRWLERVTPLPEDKKTVRMVVELFQNDHPSVIYAKKILNSLNPRCRDKFAVNFIANHLVIADELREKFRHEEGFQPPMTILVSPSMRCNLRCKGCYAAEYEREEDLPAEIFDRIINEGEEIGTAFYTILGGEPLLYPPLFEVLERHKDSYFQIYTNATLLDEKIVKKLVALGNTAIMFSIEGSKEETDARRAPGVYEKVMRGMDMLREAGVLFGFSVYVTRYNVESVTSDAFIDKMVEKGAYLGWYFLCMPVGKNPSTEFMPTPEQRHYLKERRDYIRDHKPLFMIDFWNDAPFVRGCISARQFIHINNRGDIEPCVFMHFAQHNIKTTSLRQALKGSFMKYLKDRQPYDDNLYLPCTIIDNPDILRQAVRQTHPYPTHEGAESLINDPKICAELDKYAKALRPLYAPDWEEDMKKDMWARVRDEIRRKRAGEIVD